VLDTRWADSPECRVRFLEEPFFFCYTKSPAFSALARFRIRQRPSCVRPWEPVFDVEERVLWWWESRGTSFLRFDAALKHLEDLDSAPPNVERKVVYEKH
jgi:hypothetical protein